MQKRDHIILTGESLKLNYLHGGEALYQPGEILGPRELQDFELVYIIEGEVAYETGGQSYTIAPGGFVLSHPGISETYRWDVVKRTRHAFLHFGMEQRPEDWSDPFGWPKVRAVENTVSIGLFRPVLHHLYEHKEWTVSHPPPFVCRMVEVLIDSLLEVPHSEHMSFERERPEPVHLALMYIHGLAEENPFHQLTLAELAAQANVTEKYLCRLFSKWVGLSPMRTYSLLKLESSLPLLARTNLCVKEVAMRCGFANPFYFSRLFSKTFGCSPSSYRENLEQGALLVTSALPSDIFPRIRW